jgi:low affinity Fe/Cu permease
MVALSDVELSAAMHERPARDAARPRRRKRALSGIARFAGVVLMLAAVGIWIVSAPMFDSGMMVLRLAVSVFFMCMGLMLLQVGRGAARDEIHLDRRAGALRHIQRGRDGIARTRHEVALADLGEATILEDTLILRDRAGTIVMELSGMPRDQLQLIDRELQRA